jgi:hypothetical protein
MLTVEQLDRSLAIVCDLFDIGGFLISVLSVFHSVLELGLVGEREEKVVAVERFDVLLLVTED